MSCLTRIFFAIALTAAMCSATAQRLPFSELAGAAADLTRDRVVYDPSYFKISYPNGDVPADRGVCTDVVIRAYRKLNIDLQKEVHEDMRANFRLYPANWGLTSCDRNIGSSQGSESYDVLFQERGSIGSHITSRGLSPRRYCNVGPRARPDAHWYRI